jgi:Arc/MetJ family transcription regulator
MSQRHTVSAALEATSNGDIIVPCMEVKMRTTLALDDDLVAKAQAFTGLKEKSSLVREALKALIERESARRLARLGGSEISLEAPPRRRPASA